MKTLKNLISVALFAASSLVSGFPVVAQSTYYSQNMLAPGTILSSASTGTTPFGSTNLVAANYPQNSGPWLTLYGGSSIADPKATGVTMQFVTGVPYIVPVVTVFTNVIGGVTTTGTNTTYNWTNGVSPWATNAAAALTNNLIWTFAMALDDVSISKDAVGNGIVGTPSWSPQGPLPWQTNTTFNVTSTVASIAGPTAFSVFVPGTNFLGNNHFRLVSVNYKGTNTPYLAILSARAGYRYQQ